MKKLLLLFLASFISVASFAQKVGIEEARGKAFSLFRNGAAFAKGNGGMAQPELSYCAEKDAHTCFYVFNNPYGGFAIIGGDETAREVLGYCSEGKFDINNIPDNLREMLQSYEEQIVAGIKFGTKDQKAKASAPKADIAPLITTEWGQDDPFNCMIPSFGAGYKPLITGCNATAASQIMKYYNYAKGKGSNSYQQTWNTGSGTITLTFEANFGATTYDFANMLNSYIGSYNNTQAQAVGELLYHAGVAMDMDYGQNGSSSSTQAPGRALANNFGYDKSIALIYSAYYTEDEWRDIIYGELSAARPVLYSGRSASDGGHAFILHGYRASDDTYMVNWGWNGSFNGYYALTGSNALSSPGGQYNDGQAATINIKPDQGGRQSISFTTRDEVKMSTTTSIGNAVNTYELNKGAGDKNLNLFALPNNPGLFDASIEYGVAFRNTVTGEVVYTGGCGTTSLKSTYFFTTYFRMPFNTSLLTKNGTYEVMPSFRPEGSTDNNDWQLMRVDRSTNIPTIKVFNAEGGEKIDINFTINSANIFTGKTAKISAPVTYNGTLTFTSSDESVATVSNDGTVTGVAPGTATITVSGTGTDSYNATTKDFTITVEKKPKSYNPYLSMMENVSGGSTEFQILNNGTESIYITKLVIKNKSDYSVRGTYTVEQFPSYFGTLAANRSKGLTIDTNVPIVYNWHYTYNGNTFVYCNDSNDPSYEPDEEEPTPPTPPTPSTIDVTGITLSATAKTVKVGETFTLTATVAPSDATNKEIEWTSSNTDIATVDANGKVTAVAVGTATITAKAKDGSNVSASCEVKVNPDNTALIAELTSIVSDVKNAYNSLRNLNSDMDKYLEGRIKVGETKKYEEQALQEIDAAFNAYMSKAENFIDQLNNNHVATNEELNAFKNISDAFTKNEVLSYFKYYALKAEITAEGNGKVEFCGYDVRNETKKFVYYYPKVYTGVEILCNALGVTSHNPMIFFSENACTSMDNSTYCFDATLGMRDPETHDKDIQIPVEYDNEKIKVVFHDNTAIISELGNALNSTKSEYEKTANLSKDMEQFLDGCIRTSGMKDAENAAMQDVKVAYEAICKNVEDYIALLNDHHTATDSELKKYRTLTKALDYNSILDYFKEYTDKATIKAEGNGKVEFVNNVVRNETKTFAFYYPKAYAGVESLCYGVGVKCSNSIDFFNEKAIVTQDDATCCFDVVKANATPVTYEKDMEIAISGTTSITVTFHDYSTGIRGINAHDEDAKVYDLSGRQVKAQRGINIVVDKNGNRRKVVVK